MRLVSIFTLIFLTGCAGVGLNATSDPDVKIQQSYQMMNEGRYSMAKDLIRQAMATYKEDQNILGIAEAYHTLGNLYKYPVDGGGNADYARSGTYYEKAKEYYEQAGNETGVIKSIVGIGNSYYLRKNNNTACQYYDEALTRYNSGKAAGKITAEPVILDQRYKNMGDVINAFMVREKCST
jgi:tetratricopeptide (TPR) repeat protein